MNAEKRQCLSHWGSLNGIILVSYYPNPYAAVSVLTQNPDKYGRRRDSDFWRGWLAKSSSFPKGQKWPKGPNELLEFLWWYEEDLASTFLSRILFLISLPFSVDSIFADRNLGRRPLVLTAGNGNYMDASLQTQHTVNANPVRFYATANTIHLGG